MLNTVTLLKKIVLTHSNWLFLIRRHEQNNLQQGCIIKCREKTGKDQHFATMCSLFKKKILSYFTISCAYKYQNIK